MTTDTDRTTDENERWIASRRAYAQQLRCWAAYRTALEAAEDRGLALTAENIRAQCEAQAALCDGLALRNWAAAYRTVAAGLVAS